ncbi:type IV pilus assembly protein PilN [Desulfotomaculum arcticum]|uniref:Type IV pilus assembly protein PilN n=1 Tax=Desulfotruncus arcticus DSM 17038 TaxID=1121424 RepID=A0A1I2MTU9_9FIRM|nr:PilN domain-containing protein [Desulfotruncus arcticus]SFF92776.1 type IV pilus assembly protein PilN [Desulfotomaculum arcticum] [Desulfotruncus arcticus DSM 17038]
MAVNINLLPSEIKLQWELKQKQQRFVVVGSLTGILLLIIFGFLLVATFQARKNAAVLAKENEALLNSFPALEQYAALQARVNNGEIILKQAVGAPPDWVNILYDLGQCMPPDIWLTDFSAAYQQGSEKQPEKQVAKTAESKPAENKAAVTGEQLRGLLGMQAEQPEEAPLDGGIVIGGYADDQLSVAELLKNMQQVKGLTGANCRMLAQEELDGKTVIRFEIQAELLPGSSIQPTGETAEDNQS